MDDCCRGGPRTCEAVVANTAVQTETIRIRDSAPQIAQEPRCSPENNHKPETVDISTGDSLTRRKTTSLPEVIDLTADDSSQSTLEDAPLESMTDQVLSPGQLSSTNHAASLIPAGSTYLAGIAPVAHRQQTAIPGNMQASITNGHPGAIGPTRLPPITQLCAMDGQTWPAPPAPVMSQGQTQPLFADSRSVFSENPSREHFRANNQNVTPAGFQHSPQNNSHDRLQRFSSQDGSALRPESATRNSVFNTLLRPLLPAARHRETSHGPLLSPIHPQATQGVMTQAGGGLVMETQQPNSAATPMMFQAGASTNPTKQTIWSYAIPDKFSDRLIAHLTGKGLPIEEASLQNPRGLFVCPFCTKRPQASCNIFFAHLAKAY